ncbi:type IV pilus modification PilV family protein [Imhoffiella purpurea]|uniref:Type IV fimbrial biogenesis protein PilV n=1 Tax=Imhoffiella purpurea TaxID=1249627 RepID=W9V1J6_9GAMM|nr:hypothetical protein [Imhoffiella purpurea]EXJ13323.1 hypothetical protein D779_3848 [Imhoffiella purpurea]
MRRNRIQARQHGFSLNEALVSMTVLTSGLLGLAQFQGEMVRHGGETRTRTSALALAQHKLEELRERAGTDFDGIQNGSDNPAQGAGDQTAFRRSWNVTPHTDPTYKEILVATAWTSVAGEHESVGLVSLIAPNAPYSARPNVTRTPTQAQEARPPSEETAATETTHSSDPGKTGPYDLDSDSRAATCLCRRDGDGNSRLDSRSTDANCTPDCCQTAESSPSAALCDTDDCSFVARCP